jgi:ribosomal protein L11 methylase PrmA
MTLPRAPGSFRDPHGAVHRDGEDLLRTVRPSYAETWDRMHASGFLDAVWRDELLVRHEECDAATAAVDGPVYKLLRPERVPFVSHPYEWCFGQLREAALLTLRLQRRALEFDLSLKDATAYNVQFVGAQPVFIDTLSFEPVREGRPWLAYRQFCEHFLAPLALVATRGPELAHLLRVHLDGIPLDLARRLLPWRTRLRPGLFLHLHLHARAQRVHSETPRGVERARRATLSRRALHDLVEALEGTVAGLSWQPDGTVWADYERTCDYAPASASAKEAAVRAFLAAERPSSVFDLGANTGHYARISSAAGISTMALDGDPAAVERCFRDARRREDRRLLPLWMDLTNPSPDLGWRQQERIGLAARGPADAALALALVHHLVLGAGIPLAEVAGGLAALGRALLLEFVPREDPQAQRLLATRDDVAADYDAGGVEAAFAPFYRLVGKTPLPESGRMLMHFGPRG